MGQIDKRGILFMRKNHNTKNMKLPERSIDLDVLVLQVYDDLREFFEDTP